MNTQASIGILFIFFLWVLVATIWWSKKIKYLENQETLKESSLKKKTEIK
tara:strand:- start:8049 stop:8198 length:150 start_codon:yes stop_codon:yes gene_type:complete